MAITKEWLKKASNAQSFSRGQGYYDDVDDLVKSGNTYTATVYGSEEYQVQIIDYPVGNPSAFCDCPYDYDGICKHIVAVGLNIIDGNFDDESGDNEVLNISAYQNIKMPDTPHHTFYEDVFLKKEEVIRTAFLKQLFAKDESLRMAFVLFTTPIDTRQPDIIADLVEHTTQRFAKKLEKITKLDPDTYYSKGRGRYHDYYDDNEGLDEWVDEKIDAVFSPFEIEIKNYLQNGVILNATKVFIGLYEGSVGADFEHDMDNYLPEGLEDILIGKVEMLIQNLKKELAEGFFQELDIKESSLLILDRWQNRKDSVETIAFFETFLTVINTSKSEAQWLIKELKNRQLEQDLINLTLSVAEIVEDNAYWIAQAEKAASDNTYILQLLLDKYKSLNMLSEFHKAGRIAFEKFPMSNFTTYLKEHILEEYDKDLYIKVYFKSAQQTSSLSDFLKVRHLLSQPKSTQFITECKERNKNLYVDILHHDGNLKGILEFVELNKKIPSFQSSYYFPHSFDMHKAFSYIINDFTDDVFDIVLSQLKDALNRMSLDRNGYAQALSYLKPLKNIPESHREDLKTLVQSLQERYKSRPAFLDELKKLGLKLR